MFTLRVFKLDDEQEFCLCIPLQTIQELKLSRSLEYTVQHRATKKNVKACVPEFVKKMRILTGMDFVFVDCKKTKCLVEGSKSWAVNIMLAGVA